MLRAQSSSSSPSSACILSYIAVSGSSALPSSFFFQAEDGIRAADVTGVQTCALPISQLLSRHWYIGDATGKVEEVQGPGVVGENPVLEPGDTFEYTSGCPLTTPFGWMEGTYEMVRPGGEHFEAKIARFALREPGAIH